MAHEIRRSPPLTPDRLTAAGLAATPDQVEVVQLAEVCDLYVNCDMPFAIGTGGD